MTQRSGWSSTFAGLAPRNTAQATRTAAVITSAAAANSAVFAIVEPGVQGPLVVSVLVPVALVLVAVVLPRLSGPVVPVLCLLVPIAGLLLILALDLGTHNAGASSQVFFCLPVLFAAAQLRWRSVVLVTFVALACDAAVALEILNVRRALIDLSYVGTTNVLIAVLLARAGWQQDRLHARLEQLAAVDPLTGLVNRRVLDDSAASALASANAGAGTALVIVDVDGFKTVNDAFGHPAGDAALSHIANLLTTYSRPSDVVARMGGDEMGVLMPGCTYAVAVQRAQEFVRIVRNTPLPRPGQPPIRLTISAGAAHVPESAASLRELYSGADAALYRAKHAGRDQVGVAS